MSFRSSILALSLTLSSAVYSTAQAKLSPQLLRSADAQAMNRWVDSVYKQLSPRERMGQLLMPIIYPQPADSTDLYRRLRTEAWGGILFQKGFLADQRLLTIGLQEQARVPLLIALDGEWGLFMRLKDAPRYPRNKVLSDAASTQLIEDYGREVARQCRLMGIHINFAPVLDVNSNPRNPVIGTRSFGNTVEQVVRAGLAYARGLESGQVLSVAKHFPGHGDTSEDSHKTLPSILAPTERLERLELAPFKEYISAGFGGMMTAHLRVPALDATGRPASLSKPISTDLLQDRLGFKGLIFTDALEMKGAQLPAGESLAVAALLAGNDILLGLPQPHKALDELMAAYRSGRISPSYLERKCKKVLSYKYALIIASKAPAAANPERVKALIWSPQEAQLRKRLSALEQKQRSEADPTAHTGRATK